MTLKKIILSFLVISAISVQTVWAGAYQHIKPELLTVEQTSDYSALNETLSIIFNKLRYNIKTDKYPKYFHNYTLEKDDGTQSSTYNYVKMYGAELIYNIDTNDLKYVSFRRPELEKCRILYDYPSGKLHAVQVFSKDSQTFIFSSDGKYVDYEPYIKNVREKVLKNLKMPSRKKIEAAQKDKTELLIQTALTVNKDGRIEKIKMLKTPAIEELETCVYDAIKASTPFDKFPDNFFNEEITIILNFNFSL